MKHFEYPEAQKYLQEDVKRFESCISYQIRMAQHSSLKIPVTGLISCKRTDATTLPYSNLCWYQIQVKETFVIINKTNHAAWEL